MTDKDVEMQDESDDEDYNPNEEPQEEDDEDDVLQIQDAESTTHLSTVQLKAVDAAFEQMFGYKWGTYFQFPDRSLTRQEKVLLHILGPKAAATILQSKVAVGKQKTVIRKRQNYKQTLKRNLASKSIQGEPQDSNRPDNAQTSGGIDQLLKNISEPAPVTTVAKTSHDWERFKDQSGLGTKLEEQVDSKNAYLKKQDFLTRVDHRKFEIERQERERDRVKQAGSNK